MPSSGCPHLVISLVWRQRVGSGLDVGPVRPPLQEPAAEHVQKLAELIALGDTMLDTAAP